MEKSENFHIGNAIHEQLLKNGQSVVWLAKQLKVKRATLYRIFANPHIDTFTLQQISVVLRHNFAAEFAELLDIRIDKLPKV